MKPNKYKTNLHPNALIGISNGIKIATEVVASTMGAKGMNVAMEEDEYPYVSISNDGATIIEKMQLEDPMEKMGLNFMKEAVNRSNNNSGDGSTTTCVLLNAILQEGIKTGATGIALKNELDALLPQVISLIDEQTKPVTDVTQVATIAGESEEFGQLLGEIYNKIGKDGIIRLEGSGTYDTSYDFIQGVRFPDTGYLSPYMVHDEQAVKDNQKETKAYYENPTILVTKKKIATIADINPLLETLEQLNKKDLVIFMDDMDSGVASLLIKAHKEKVINICIIKAPVIYKNSVFEDFAKCVGATVIEDSSGVSSFKNMPLSVLGSCETLTVTKDETVLTGIKDISEHIAELNKLTDTESLMRLCYLNQKTVLLKLGALSETDLFYKRLKMEDAIYSSRRALAGGIVAGGGVCLLNVSNKLTNNVLKEAFKAPITQILRNASVREFNLTEGEDFGGEKGYDAKNDTIANMFESGIIDSSDIVKGAVRNAMGIASTILTVSCLVSKPEKTVEQLTLETLQGKGMRF